MGNAPNPIAYTQSKCGNRTYAFSFKKSEQGATLLKISESVNGSFSTNEITILKRDIPAFKQAFKSVYFHLFPQNEPKYNVAEIRKSHQNAYKKWSASEEDYLLLLEAEGLTIPEIAIEMGRQIGGIQSRLKKLNML